MGPFLAVYIAMLSIAPSKGKQGSCCCLAAPISVSTHFATLTQQTIPCYPFGKEPREPKQGATPSPYFVVLRIQLLPSPIER